MLQIFNLVGCPASGKSTWAKGELVKNPKSIIRINNDDIRSMLNLTVFDDNIEKVVTSTRLFMIEQALRRNLSVMVDNVNASKKHWDDLVRIAKKSNKDVQLIEKPFYLSLEELIARDSKREGKACVGEEVIKRFWNKLGGKQFQFYKPKQIIITSANRHTDEVTPLVQDEKLPRAVIFDNDGTINLMNGRNPYDASTCDNDLPHEHVIECMKLYFNAGYKILFVSGREEKDREPTEKFYQKHFPEVKYELYMRPTGNMEKDVIIKERIFNQHIKDKYYVAGWFDDRLQICRWLYQSGFPLFRVNDPEAVF
jgi:predicted kinase